MGMLGTTLAGLGINSNMLITSSYAEDLEESREKVKNLNKMVSVLSKELDLNKFDKEFQNNIESVLEDHYNDKIKDHESYINLLKSNILDCESNIDKIRNLGGVAGGELIKSLNESKHRLAVAKNTKEKDL